MSHRAEAPRLLINARMVKEKDRARARELRRLVICGAAILVPLLVYVWQRVDFLRVSYEVEALKKERQELQEKNKHFSVERSFLMSPDRIERMARQELGLVDPPPADVRRVAVIDGRINQVQARAGSPGGEAGRVIEAGLGIIPAVGMATSRRRDDKVKP
ncbi:MAG: cell division protein FtsL [Acidobacteriota bacterium]|jgi:cell division protein FtsL